MVRLVFVDVESRGSKAKPVIKQIAAIATDSQLNEIAGFEAKISKASEAEKVARDFANFLTRNATNERFNAKGELFRVAQLVAHNANFDIEILRNWYRKHSIFLPADYLPLCTMQFAMWHFQFESNEAPIGYKLVHVCEYLGIQHSKDDAHDAFRDIRATVLLCRKISRRRCSFG